MDKLNWGKIAYIVFLLYATTAIALPAQTLTTLYSFDSTDGTAPDGGLVQATDGNLYGTTGGGGAYGGGTFFNITPSGTLTSLFSFCTQSGCTSGSGPLGGVIQATDGNFYGTTNGGGIGQGTVFRITPGGTLTTLYNFCSLSSCADGSDLFAGLVQANDGNFYGTTSSGGNGREAGTVFKITPTGTLTTLYSFCSQSGCTDGESPLAGLVQGPDGNFYGTTEYGGANTTCGATQLGCGTIFEISPTGTLTTLHSFDGTDGITPYFGALIQATDGNFYGTTVCGGASGGGSAACSPGDGAGTVFKINPSGTLTTLYSFCSLSGCIDGASPTVGLVQATDGNLYGTTSEGGASGYGTVFEITTSGVLTTLHSFAGLDGESPAGLVQDTNGMFYGETGAGGAYAVEGASGYGTIFSLSVGLGPFVKTLPAFGSIGTAVTILGNNLTGATAVSFNGTAAAFTVASDTEIQTTAPSGATTGIVQVATPGGTLNSNVPFQITAGQALPIASVAPTSLTFGNQNLGTTSASQPVTLSNTGSTTLTISSIATSANFGETNTCGGSVAASSSCTINVTFSPTATGTLTGTLTITDNSNGVAGSMQTVSLSGTGTAPAAGVSPPSLTFSSQSEGTTSTSQPVTLSNTGNATLTISSIATSANFGQTNTCAGSVAASSSCTINVTFSPTATGTLTGTLTITDNSNGVAGSMQTVSLSGTGTAPVAGVSPPGLTFSSQIEGTTSASQPVTLSNTGTTTLSLTSIATSANFGETNACAGSVAATSSCTINVTFSPTATGTLTGTLTITDNSNAVAGSMQTVALTGTGMGTAAASLSATSLSFGSQVIDTASTAKKVTLTSSGTANLNILSFAITGTNAGDFAETNNCPASMAPASKCTISLTYTPSVLGAETASLAVNNNAANSPQTVALSGTGESPVVLSPASVSFGNVGEKSPSASKSITLTNHQSVPLTITGIALSNPDYTETNTCNGSVTAKGTCAISVTLTPSALGADDATLSVNDSASNTPQTATLTGTGVAPAKLSAASLGFGNVPQSTPSASKDITLTNNEDVPLTISGIATGNPDFTETDTCDGGVPAQSQCIVTIMFTPRLIGVETGTLTVTDAASNSPQTATLTGTGIAQAAVSPASLTFAALKVGSTSAAKNVSLTNNLSTALTIASVALTGADLGDFAVSANTCGASLAANSQCTISLTFTPGGTGTRTATMAVMDSANDSPQSVSLTGMGIPLSQTIAFSSLPNRVLGNPPFTVSATASSGLPVSFASLTTAVCTVSGNTVTLVSVGRCTIQATQAGNATYAPATPVSQGFQVTAVVQPPAAFYTISQAQDINGQHQLGEINPANGAFVQQFFVSLPADGGVNLNVNGLAFGNGSLWAISKAVDINGQHQLWEINPANGGFVQQFLVSLPGEAGTNYFVGGLAFGNGDLWAISESVDINGHHQLWEINPTNGGFVKQFLVSLPGEAGTNYFVGGLAFGNGGLWAISESVDINGHHQLWEINPANGGFVKQFLVSLPGEAGTNYFVGGLAFGNRDLWAISESVDINGHHQLWEINPANGGFVQQFLVSLPADGGVSFNVGGLAWQ